VTLRAVLDTNVVLSSILFSRGRLTWLRELWRAGHLLPLCSRDTVSELIRVLAYPKFRLTTEDAELLLSAYLPYAELVVVEDLSVPRLPRCSDEADQRFLVLAAAGRAEVLVTGDKALRALAGRTPFAIETPAHFRSRFP
jgi:putative toxin-antitoxin system toxin component, PIN family